MRPRLVRMLAVFLALLGAPLTRHAHAQDAVAERGDDLERRPYVMLHVGVGFQSPAAEHVFDSYGGFALSAGLAWSLRSRLLARAEYQGQWYLRDSEAAAPCPEDVVCARIRYVSDHHAGALLLERQSRGAAEGRLRVFGLIGAGAAWSAEPADDAGTTPIGVVGAGVALRSSARSERGLRLEARYTIFARDTLGSRGLTSVLFGIAL
jgi:hypothetical protein